MDAICRAEDPKDIDTHTRDSAIEAMRKLQAQIERETAKRQARFDEVKAAADKVREFLAVFDREHKEYHAFEAWKAGMDGKLGQAMFPIRQANWEALENLRDRIRAEKYRIANRQPIIASDRARIARQRYDEALLVIERRHNALLEDFSPSKEWMAKLQKLEADFGALLVRGEREAA